MNLEHLSIPDINRSTVAIVRLSNFTTSEIQALIEEIDNSLVLTGNPIRLHSLPFIRPLNCELNMTLTDEDKGIHQVSSGQFICSMSHKGYIEMMGLMKPFAVNRTSGFQWLYDLPIETTSTEFLLSSNGKW